MCREERLIFALARDESKEIEVLLDGKAFDWQYFFSLLYKHKIAPFILDKFLCKFFSGRFPDLLKKKCKAEISQSLLDTRLICHELSVIKNILDKQGIGFILIKGPTLNKFYLRTVGDLDILIKEADLLRAIRVLRTAGYFYLGNQWNRLLTRREKMNIQLQTSWNNQYQLYNTITGLCLELHINLFEKKRAYQEDLSTIWEQVELFWKEKKYNCTLQCYELSQECLLVLMCLHTALKRSPANRTFILRNVVDIAWLVKAGLDWHIVYGLACRLKIIPYLYFSLRLTKKLMKTAIPFVILNALKVELNTAELFLIRIHLRVLKKLSAFSFLHAIIYKLLKPFVFGKTWRVAWRARLRSLLILPCLFPPRWRMADSYHLSTTSPLLAFTYLIFPIQALYRFFKNKINGNIAFPVIKRRFMSVK